MVRKYFDITEAQENALKERAQALGTSEDELTRRAPAPLDRDELYADRSHRE